MIRAETENRNAPEIAYHRERLAIFQQLLDEAE